MKDKIIEVIAMQVTLYEAFAHIQYIARKLHFFESF